MLDKHLRQFAIIKIGASIGGALPGAKMNFINGDRLLVPVRRFTLGKPFIVTP